MNTIKDTPIFKPNNILNIIEPFKKIVPLLPIIVVSFFVCESFIMWDLKGIIYIAGLLLTVVFTLLSNSMLKNVMPIPDNMLYDKKCTQITLGGEGHYFSNIPLSLVIYSYTFLYLLVFIFNLANKDPSKGILNKGGYNENSINSALQQNIPILIIFPLLILMELWRIFEYNCISSNTNEFIVYALTGIVVGALGGLLWAVIVTSLGVPQLQYIVSKNEDVCSRPSRSTFRCTPKHLIDK